MTNILPPKEKEYLRLEQAKKIVIILGFAAIVSLICLLLILLSIKYYILSAAGSQKFILQESEKMYQASDFAESPKGGNNRTAIYLILGIALLIAAIYFLLKRKDFSKKAKATKKF